MAAIFRNFKGLILPAMVVLSFLGRGAPGLSAGGGGPYLQLHASSLSRFDPALAGNPIVVGGEGFTVVGKDFRLGGGGGGGFIWSPSVDTQLALGYGGLVAEYGLKPWLDVRCLLGGGGYAVNKTVSESSVAKTSEKISSGGFLLVVPSVGVTISASDSVKLGFRLGYFLPNVSNLQSALLSIHLSFGKQ